METEPFPELILSFFSTSFKAISFIDVLAIVSMLFLLMISALISGSEVAFFSLKPASIKEQKKLNTNSSKYLVELLQIPERLLATILITNNFVNIGIVILSTYVSNSLFDFSQNIKLGFAFQVVIVTFLLLLFGEIIPKVYANQYSLKFARLMVFPIVGLERIFRPLSSILINSTSFVNKRFSGKAQNISRDDLSQALELTNDTNSDEKKILKGIISFGNKDVTEIMKPRVDVVAFDISIGFNKVLADIVETGFSRIPVYAETFDDVRGILYVKDLLPHYHNGDSFSWQSLIRPPYFIPPTKHISELLEEFQTNKIHLAIVVDEYGGTMGIVTLEDILEEIVGEINDEFDDEDPGYSKLDNSTFVFEGKTLLNDFYKITETEDTIFNEIKGEADTLAGLILEMKGDLPQKNEILKYQKYTFTITSMDKRRVREIKVKIG